MQGTKSAGTAANGPWEMQICGLSRGFWHLPLLRTELLAWGYNADASGTRSLLPPLMSNQQQHLSQGEIRKPLH